MCRKIILEVHLDIIIATTLPIILLIIMIIMTIKIILKIFYRQSSSVVEKNHYFEMHEENFFPTHTYYCCKSIYFKYLNITSINNYGYCQRLSLRET